VSLSEFRESANEIERILRLQTYPLAIKMLKTGEEVPEGATRPVKDLGSHIAACQGFSLSRRQGMTLAQLFEDSWCFEPVMGFGFVEPPDYFLQGHNRYPDTARTLESAQTWAGSVPHLPYGEYAGILSAPAGEAGFEPDLLMIYCDPSQLTQLLIAKDWIDGIDVTCKMSGHAACVYAVVPTLKTGGWAVTSPCRGDRMRAMARDDEVIVSIPTSAVPDAAAGLGHLQTKAKGWGLPRPLSLRMEYELPPNYAEIGKMMGMPWVK